MNRKQPNAKVRRTQISINDIESRCDIQVDAKVAQIVMIFAKQ
jgi:hypothetical protein